MELKYVIFFLALFLGVPLGVLAVLLSSKLERGIFYFSIFMSYAIDKGAINFFSHEDYRGTARGMEISVCDLGILILLLGMLIKDFRNFKFWIPGIGFYLFYLMLSVFSIVNAESYLFSFFEVWKMTMMLLFFVVSFNEIRRIGNFDGVCMVLGGIAIITFCTVMFQKYALKIYQPSGVFAHQNSMAMYMTIIGPIFLGRLLFLRRGFLWTWWDLTVFVLTSGAALLTFSRGAMLFYPLSCMVPVGLSVFKGFSVKRFSIIMVLGIMGMIGFAMLLPRMIERIQRAPESSKQTRIDLAIAARNMANDKFFGVGLNNWGIKINPPYSYAEHRTGNYKDDTKDAVVETIYMLVAAECGWVGLAALLLLFWSFFIRDCFLLFTFWKTELFYLPAGIAGGLLSIYGQSILEWVLKQSPNFYQYMLIFAMIAVLCERRRLMTREMRQQNF